MREKYIIIIGILVAVCAVWIRLYEVDSRLDRIQKDIEKTYFFSGEVLEFAKTGLDNNDWWEIKTPELWNPDAFNRFVYLYWRSHGELIYSWDTKVNSLLGTEGLLGADDLDGVVVCYEVSEQVGTYTDGWAAYRVDYQLCFVKLPERVVVKSVVLRGGSPPKTVNRQWNNTRSGKVPTKKDVADAIRTGLTQ